MLYGIEDFEIKKETLNIKKVIIFIAVVLVCFLIIFVSFFISYNAINKKNNNSNIAIATNNVKTESVEKAKKQTKTKEQIDIVEREFIIPRHDINKIKTKFIPEKNDNAKEEIKAIYTSEEKQVYLTFDDGPTKNITPQILDILKRENVPATFFVLGYRVDLSPNVLKRAFEEGHYIANHGYSHKYSQIYDSPESTWNEYIQCEQSIKNALQNQEYNSYLFRFPGGSSGGKYEDVKEGAREIFDQNKVAYTNWNCLTGDAAGAVTKEEQMAELIESKEENQSVILLMHDAADKQVTVDTLPEIIQYFKEQGYVFKNFYEIF